VTENSLAKALALLPHGAEFRFIDRLLSLEPGKRAIGEYQVPEDAAFLRGHFPGEPLFPGVLLIEAAAQLAGVVAQSDPTIAPLGALKLAGVRAVKFTGSARPGETIRVEAGLTGRLANVVSATAGAWVEDQLVLRAELTLSGEVARPDSR
jgi:3-hydroxyacyl-[acyl-carrier-protein] dehydratase